MGKREADLDGIKYYYDPDRGSRGKTGCTVFLVPCSKCGRTIERTSYGRNKDYICDACSLGIQKKKQAIAESWLDEIETKGERRFNSALDELQSQVGDLHKYGSAIKAARRATEKYGSIPEVLVAIELIHLGYKIIPQLKVGKYRVDFFIPDERIAVEVDGETFHRNNRNSNREATIQMSLGLDVTIVHLPAELIRKDIKKLKKCIEVSTNRNHGTY